MRTKRIKQFKYNISKLGIDCVLIYKPSNMRYLSNFSGDSGFLLITESGVKLFTDSRYIEQAQDEVFEGIVALEHKYPIADFMIDQIKSSDIRVLGIEEKHMTMDLYLKLRENLGSVKFLNVQDELNDMRSKKDDVELNNIKKAQEITDNAFEYICNFIKPGMREIEVAAELEYYFKKNGASGPSFPTIVVSGKNGSKPHGVPGEKIITEGEFVTMDFGCVYNGYCSDMTRTIAIGKVDEQMREVYNIVLKAQENAINNIHAHMALKDADKLARDIIESAGYGQYFGHSLGHGVGLEIHEHPAMGPRSEGLLMPNMLVTVEPGIYIPKRFGVRIEDMIVITENGIIDLTNSNKHLIIL